MKHTRSFQKLLRVLQNVAQVASLSSALRRTLRPDQASAVAMAFLSSTAAAASLCVPPSQPQALAHSQLLQMARRCGRLLQPNYHCTETVMKSLRRPTEIQSRQKPHTDRHVLRWKLALRSFRGSRRGGGCNVGRDTADCITFDDSKKSRLQNNKWMIYEAECFLRAAEGLKWKRNDSRLRQIVGFTHQESRMKINLKPSLFLPLSLIYTPLMTQRYKKWIYIYIAYIFIYVYNI